MLVSVMANIIYSQLLHKYLTDRSQGQRVRSLTSAD